MRSSNDSLSDTEWNNNHANSTSNEITVTNVDVAKNAQFYCIVNFDDEKITT
jgi:HKD family nuclease